jgi:hypothetical protein
MIQPLSGDNSVLGICFISESGGFVDLNKRNVGCRAERLCFCRGPERFRGRSNHSADATLTDRRYS